MMSSLAYELTEFKRRVIIDLEDALQRGLELRAMEGVLLPVSRNFPATLFVRTMGSELQR